MNNLYKSLQSDVRFVEGLKACMNCGTCTAICAAANFYNYSPRKITEIVQSKNEEAIKLLLCSDEIWYCGECMSCKTRCPRGNAPGLIIMALRSLSQDLGYFVESEKGRQQLALKRTVGKWMLQYGYCVPVNEIKYENHLEQGQIWKWYQENLPEVMEKLGGNFQKDGPGTMRNIPQSALDELNSIFEVTGAFDRYQQLENASELKAKELGWEFDSSNDCEYFNHITKDNNKNHSKKE